MVSGPSIVSNPIETATIRKLRIRLLPLLFALYVVAFIDRINLGFARQKGRLYGGQAFQNKEPSPTAKAEPMRMIQNET